MSHNSLLEAVYFMAKSPYIHILLFLIVFDFITGYSKAIFWKVTDSTIGLKGITKHIVTFILYFAIGTFTKFINNFGLGQIFLIIICLNYFISILENCGTMGIYVPKFLSVKVAQEIKRYEDKLIIASETNKEVEKNGKY